MLELLKVVVQPVVVERDADGNVIGEKVGDAVAIYRPDALVEYVEALRAELEQANLDELAKTNGGGAAVGAT